VTSACTGARADTPSLSSSELKASGLEAKGWTVAADGKSLAKTWIVSDFNEGT
jgi:pterin-4a-carbinolamine dehydratase